MEDEDGSLASDENYNTNQDLLVSYAFLKFHVGDETAFARIHDIIKNGRPFNGLYRYGYSRMAENMFDKMAPKAAQIFENGSKRDRDRLRIAIKKLT